MAFTPAQQTWFTKVRIPKPQAHLPGLCEASQSSVDGSKAGVWHGMTVFMQKRGSAKLKALFVDCSHKPTSVTLTLSTTLGKNQETL